MRVCATEKENDKIKQMQKYTQQRQQNFVE
jgi:hypothetical protein